MLRSRLKRRSKQSNGSLPTESIPRSLSLVTAGGETIVSLSDTVAESLRYLLVRLRSRNEFPSTLALRLVYATISLTMAGIRSWPYGCLPE
jgi:hypothetical protein